MEPDGLREYREKLSMFGKKGWLTCGVVHDGGTGRDYEAVVVVVGLYKR
jgi:hypothetical protein